MEIIPAIDLYGGRCVQLYQGNYETAEVYDVEPTAIAREFEIAGASRIHIVDLDAARGNKFVNRKIIRKIRRAVSCMVQMGGGIRSDEDIEWLLDLGIDRMIIGTAFARSPDLLEGWTSHYGNIFIAGIDARGGKVFVDGWEHETNNRDIDLAVRASNSGAESIIYTNIDKDGTLTGPDIAGTMRIAAGASIPVILSGGVSNPDDIKRTAIEGKGKISGIILGKSLYKHAINLSQVISQYQTSHTGA